MNCPSNWGGQFREIRFPLMKLLKGREGGKSIYDFGLTAQ